MDFLREIWQTITKNKSRSVLTAFGVFWGMLMLVVLIGMGNALTNGIYSNIDGFAMNSCVLSTNNTSKPYKGFQRGRSWNMQSSDLQVLQQKVQGVKAYSPVNFAGSLTVSHGEMHNTYQLCGVTADYPQVMAVKLLYGRFINRHDLQEKRKVCVIGNEVYKVLFPRGGNPVGEYLYCGNMQYRIIGVRAANTNQIYIGGDPDQMLLAPITTVQQVYNMGDVIHLLMAVSADGIPVSQIENSIKTILRDLHQIAPDDDKAIWGFNAEEEMRALGYLKIGLNALIWLIGLGTLISGAVGVMNIMLVTVRERTKEIGVRRAIGASPWLIARQIMAESTVLTAAAGTIGISTGVLLLYLTAPLLEQSSNSFMRDPQIAFQTAILCLCVIILIGVLAGLLPALRALKIKPIEALSEE